MVRTVPPIDTDTPWYIRYSSALVNMNVCLHCTRNFVQKGGARDHIACRMQKNHIGRQPISAYFPTGGNKKVMSQMQ
jgi:hypothetical protein